MGHDNGVAAVARLFQLQPDCLSAHWFLVSPVTTSHLEGLIVINCSMSWNLLYPNFFLVGTSYTRSRINNCFINLDISADLNLGRINISNCTIICIIHFCFEFIKVRLTAYCNVTDYCTFPKKYWVWSILNKKKPQKFVLELLELKGFLGKTSCL